MFFPFHISNHFQSNHYWKKLWKFYFAVRRCRLVQFLLVFCLIFKKEKGHPNSILFPYFPLSLYPSFFFVTIIDILLLVISLLYLVFWIICINLVKNNIYTLIKLFRYKFSQKFEFITSLSFLLSHFSFNLVID